MVFGKVQTIKFMLANGNKTRRMGMGYISMATISSFIKEDGKMIWNQEQESKYIAMAFFMKEYSKTTSKTAKGITFIQANFNIKEFLIKIQSLDTDSSLIRMATNTEEI